jgi:hypothetical protein
LIDDTGSARDKPVANAMESPKVQLIVRLDGHKAHVPPLSRFGDSLGIKMVVLIELQKWRYKSYRHEPDFVTLRRQRCPNKVTAKARFHTD